MEKIRVELGDRSYSIYIGSGNLDEIGERVSRFKFSPRIAIVSNPTVFDLYGKRVKGALVKEGFEVSEVIIPDGEQYKSFDQVHSILTELLKLKFDRRSAVLALGGGVIGDIACFAASIYMRGIACVQVPTTLLSQVDSSVGGKTGVNHELGKNMIGTFYQPSLVWIDTEVLKTLPRREVIAGMAEVIKYGVIRDRELFRYLSEHKDALIDLSADNLSHIIKRSCQIKAEVVSGDERESGVRAILNFGHTVGHAIETLTGYVKYLHGEAVAIGMCHEAELARIEGITDPQTVSDVCEVVKSFDLPIHMPDDLSSSSIIDAMQLDKKTISGSMRFVLPESIGSVSVKKDINRDNIVRALKFSP
ncbi:MAG: 3-dehydroquinate synthase [Thermodesulfovibrionales bacterium]